MLRFACKKSWSVFVLAALVSFGGPAFASSFQAFEDLQNQAEAQSNAEYERLQRAVKTERLEEANRIIPVLLKSAFEKAPELVVGVEALEISVEQAGHLGNSKDYNSAYVNRIVKSVFAYQNSVEVCQGEQRYFSTLVPNSSVKDISLSLNIECRSRKHLQTRKIRVEYELSNTEAKISKLEGSVLYGK